ncbi:MAG TPA: hypothetical protein VKE22_21765 [Haliangiales bacterium]|nr:hypothetical protein [Haliangiales bacterium]
MDCAEVEDSLASGRRLGPAAEAHVRACEACRSLVEDGGTLAASLREAAATSLPPDPVAGLDELLARERGARGRLRSLPRPHRLGIVAALVAALAAGVLLAAPRADLDTFPRLRLLLAVGGFAALALLSAWHALRPIYLPPAAAWATWTVLGLGLAGPLVWAKLPEVPTMPLKIDGLAPVWMAHCFFLGVVSGGALVLLVRGLDRGGRTGADMALLGAAFGGLVGNVGLLLFCPINFPLHLLLGHATVPIGLILVVGIATRASRRRRATPAPRAP